MRGRWEEMASFLCFKQRLQSITMTTRNNNERIEENASVLEETGKVLASCSYEDYTQWGKEVPTSLSPSHTHTHSFNHIDRYITSYLFICRWVWSMVVQWKIPLQGYQYNAEAGNQSISQSIPNSSLLLRIIPLFKYQACGCYPLPMSPSSMHTD